MSGHRIEVTARVDYPDGGARVMFTCVAPDCVSGHVETDPGSAAGVVVAKLAAEHDGAGVLLGVVPDERVDTP